MKKGKIIVFSIVAISFIACNSTLQLKKNTPKTNVELGVIGVQNNSLLESEFLITAIPKILNPVRIQVNDITNHGNNQKKKNDSIVAKGENSKSSIKKFNLKIIDFVSLTKEINADYNKEVLSYIKTNHKAKVITSIQVSLLDSMANLLNEADEVYLKNNRLKKYELLLYKEHKSLGSYVIPYTYVNKFDMSTFCWSENSRHQPELKYISENGQKCINSTFDSHKKVLDNKTVIKF